ncbi:hypothetical protein HMPREF0183_1802 [Brevibacterium mcbrellneri ATCC 49030]|uniref:Uncharacterized protein n=1 Tax=Brevibacterium mcbrellneri ATCC 49030 TaxID=585530 RepID=D4YPE2_9MICO|nr:hypothetical protein HMPREF0183_1802 [Brevibacterium mcbrellneri ATCC 49030]
MRIKHANRHHNLLARYPHSDQHRNKTPPTHKQPCTSGLVSTRIGDACMQQPWNTGRTALKAPLNREGHS